MDYPRLAVIGAGNLSNKRIYPNLAPAGALLVGCCDLDRARAERTALLYGGRAYADWQEMLSTETPDAVVVCIGPEAHATLAPDILRRGYPVYTEKPPAPCAAEALAVARVAGETGLLCMTGFKKRHNVAYTRAKQWLASFAADEHLAISVDYASGGYANQDARSSFLLDFALHLIDLTGFLMGEVDEVFAYAKGPNAYAVSLRFVSGAVGSLSFTDGRSFQVPTETVELTVAGGNFMSIDNSTAWRITTAGQPSEWRQPPTFVSAGDSGHETGHLSELLAFVEALKSGQTSTLSDIAQSYRTMVLYEAIRDAAIEGRSVKVAYEAL